MTFDIDHRDRAEQVSLNDVRLESFRQICEHYRQDIRMFWIGASFYILIHGAILSVFTTVKNPIMQLLLSVFGVMVSFYWWKAAKGVIFFMAQWRNLTIEINDLLQNNDGWYGRGARIVNQNKHLVPAHVTLNMAISVGLLWLSAAVYAILNLHAKG